MHTIMLTYVNVCNRLFSATTLDLRPEGNNGLGAGIAMFVWYGHNNYHCGFCSESMEAMHLKPRES